jgi:hypothetical protein
MATKEKLTSSGESTGTQTQTINTNGPGGAAANITADIETGAGGVAPGQSFGSEIVLEEKVYSIALQNADPVPDKGFSELQIEKGTYKNNVKDGKSSILLNSSRVVINSKDDYTIIAGQKGVSISSPNKVNLDADQTICLYGDQGLFLGIPNKGAAKGEQPSTNKKYTGSKYVKQGKKLRSVPADNNDYEPLVLGLRLANWLSDLVTTLKTAVILAPMGPASFREDAQWDFVALESRIKDMLSTYAYIDGWSHEEAGDVPAAPTKVTTPNPELTVDVSGLTIEIPQGLFETAQPTDPMVAAADYYTTNDKQVSLQ